MDAKRQKLSDQFDVDRKGLHSNIFSGVAIYVNGYTTPSSDELRRLMQQHGGRYELYLSRKRVTHVIASNLPNSKFKLASTMVIVKPDWITESVKAGKRLSHIPYLLLGNQSKLQPGLKSLASGKSASATTVQETHSLAGNIPEDKFNCDKQKRCLPCRSPDTSMKLQNLHDDGVSGTGNHFPRSARENCDKTPTNDFEHKNVKSCMSSDLLITPNPTDELNADDSESDTDIVYNSDEDDSTKYLIAKAMGSPQRKPMAVAGENNFLNEFYSNSRLHHISKWGAELKAYVAEIQKRGNCTFPGREKLRQSHVDRAVQMGLSETLTSGRHGACEKTIMHVDMDSFFVSVGLLTRPELRDLPVAVTHSKGQASKVNPGSNLAWEKSQWQKKRQGKLKGESTADAKAKGQTFNSMAEIASCSYQARKAGVKNGMFMGQALKLCPDLKTIPYDFDEYNRVSRVLYDLVASYTHDIEAVSCDEMFIDATDILTDTGATAMELASVLRADLMEQTSCPASVGIGPNILLARLATRKAKPNGQHQVQSSEARDFIRDQSVRDLPGVGYSMSHKLARMSVHTCGQLQAVPLAALQREFGPKTGESLHQFSLGLDSREVRGNKQRKSVSAEVNYGIRFSKESEALRFLQDLSLEVKRRLDAIKVKGRSITLKLMVRRPDAPVETAKFMGHGICNTLNKSSNLPVATNDGNLIAREVISLYRAQKVTASDVRGV
ncbi:unnamed protein product [Lymnaea stagnalis]|uniref:DNA repair protein REV1 n=1 Tax=Lymnaea stagnalis TaxID=6523 RepID=A0AAV2HQS6_LYMST